MVKPLKTRFKEVIETREPVREFVQCIIVSIGGSPTVSGRPGYCWVSEFNQPQSIFQILNRRTPHVEGLAVKVGWPEKPPFERQVVGEWDGQSFMTGYSAPSPAMWDVGEHATSHQYVDEGNIGPDPVLVYQPAIQSLKVVPVSGLTVRAQRGEYWAGSTFRRFLGANIDLTSYVPVSGTKKVLIYLDVSGAAAILDGTAVPTGSTYIPEPARPASALPLAYVQLTAGDLAVARTSVEDARGANMGSAGGVSTPTTKGQINIATSPNVSEYKKPITYLGNIVTLDGEIVYT